MIIKTLRAALIAGALTSLLFSPAHAGTPPCSPSFAGNVPVAGMQVDPNSSSLVAALYRGADDPWDGAAYTNATFFDWTYPVYYRSNANISVKIKTLQPADWSNLAGTKQPFSINFVPSHGWWNWDDGVDSQVIVLDPSTGQESDYWQVKKPVNGVLKVGAVNAAKNPDGSWKSYLTSDCTWEASRGSGIMTYALLVVPSDIEDGVIQHALSMPSPSASPDFVAPATKSDGYQDGGTPEGTRFALRMTDVEIDTWAASLPLNDTGKNSMKIVARALRDYGWMITDVAGHNHIQFEDWHSAGARWQALGIPAGNANVNLLRGLFADKSRVVAFTPPA